MYTNVLKKSNKSEKKLYINKKEIINNKKKDRLYLKEKVFLNHSLSFLCACEVMNTKDEYA